jgi:hypothetical protein
MALTQNGLPPVYNVQNRFVFNPTRNKLVTLNVLTEGGYSPARPWLPSAAGSTWSKEDQHFSELTN